MKSGIFLCALVVAVSGQRPQAIDELCGSGNVQDCRSKARECIKITTSSEGLTSRRQVVLGCVRDNDVSLFLLRRAVTSAAEEGGNPLDSLAVDENVRTEIRICILNSLNLADVNGNIDTTALKERVTTGLQNTLVDRPALQETLLAALDTCGTGATNLAGLKEYRRCMASTCIANV